MKLKVKPDYKESGNFECRECGHSIEIEGDDLITDLKTVFQLHLKETGHNRFFGYIDNNFGITLDTEGDS